MDTYLYLVLVAEFLKENTTPILIVLATFIMFVGFFIGWLVGHLRNNEVTRAMDQAICELKAANQGLKDYERFARHEIAILNREIERRQSIINARNAQHNCLFVDTAAIRLARAKLEAQTEILNVCSLSDITPQEIKNMIEEVEEVPDELLQSPLL